MSKLSEDVGAFAAGHRLEHDGKVYTFRHLSLCDLADFERQTYAIKRTELRELAEDYGAAEYRLRLDELRRNYDAHQYAMETNPSLIRSFSGILAVLQVMLPGVAVGEIDRLYRARAVEVIDLMYTTLRESFPKVREPAAGESPGGLTNGPPIPPE